MLAGASFVSSFGFFLDVAAVPGVARGFRGTFGLDASDAEAEGSLGLRDFLALGGSWRAAWDALGALTPAPLELLYALPGA